MCYYNYFKFPSYEIRRCAVDYKQRRQLLKRNRAAQQQAKLRQPHAHSWRWHLPLIEAAAHHLRQRT
jgi:hypothetical protein